MVKIREKNIKEFIGRDYVTEEQQIQDFTELYG